MPLRGPALPTPLPRCSLAPPRPSRAPRRLCPLLCSGTNLHLCATSLAVGRHYPSCCTAGEQRAGGQARRAQRCLCRRAAVCHPGEAGGGAVAGAQGCKGRRQLAGHKGGAALSLQNMPCKGKQARWLWARRFGLLGERADPGRQQRRALSCGRRRPRPGRHRRMGRLQPSALPCALFSPPIAFLWSPSRCPEAPSPSKLYCCSPPAPASPPGASTARQQACSTSRRPRSTFTSPGAQHCARARPSSVACPSPHALQAADTGRERERAAAARPFCRVLPRRRRRRSIVTAARSAARPPRVGSLDPQALP